MSTVAQRIDRHVGQRLRARREEMGFSQSRLGGHLGVSFSQIQKYERGANRIGAGRLYVIATILEVPVAYFFEDMPAAIPPAPAGAAPAEPALPGVRALTEAFCAIADAGTRESVLALVRSLVEPAALPRVIGRHDHRAAAAR